MAKFNIKADQETSFKLPEPPKSQEKALGDKMQAMVDLIAKRFRNQVLLEMNRSVVKKFADSSFGDANYAKEYRDLAKKVQRKMRRQFDYERLEKLTGQILNRTQKLNAEQFYGGIRDTLGIDTSRFRKEEGLTWQFNALKMETAEWAEKLRDDALQSFTNNTLRAMTQGDGIDELLEQFEGMAEKWYGHAQFVAQQQVGTFNSIATKMRSEVAGITEAEWVTSRDERVRPCPEVRERTRFQLDEGLYSSCDGKYLLPGTDYNCFPGSVKINHSSACDVLYRRRYSGVLTELVRDDGVVLHATPNHPVFTVDGFKPAGELDIGEDTLCTTDQRVDEIELDGDDMVPTFEQLFRAVELAGIESTVAPAARGQFHGDVSDGEVDVVALNGQLMREIDVTVSEKVAELELTAADKMIVLNALTCVGSSAPCLERYGFTADSIMRVLNLVRSRLLVHLGPLELFRFALGAWADPSVGESFAYDVAGDAKVFGDSVFALSVLVHGLDAVDRELNRWRTAPAGRDSNAELFQLPRQGGRVDSSFCRSVLEKRSGLYKRCRIVDKRRVDFTGHVYNLQTVSGDYIADTTAVSNCRCTYRLVIPAREES